MNLFIIHGRLVRDPELTQADDPTKDRCNFTVASDRRYGDEADFFDCVIFGKRAAVVSKYFHKGSEIMLFGELQTRKYETKDGAKRTAYSTVVIDFDFCGSKSKNDSEPAPVPSAAAFEETTEDIPF